VVVGRGRLCGRCLGQAFEEMVSNLRSDLLGTRASLRL
jgi:hypothetical protein